MSKGSRRREARRRARQRSEGQQPQQPSEDRQAGVEGPADERQERSEQGTESGGARRSRADRKRAQRKSGALGRASSIHVSPWLIATPIMVTVIVAVAYLILSSGSSGTNVGPAPTPTPDPRVAGQTPTASISLNVDDVNFSNTQITGKAGEVIELVVTNTGTISHNLVVAGPDDKYDTADDFEPVPWALQPGDTGRVVLKIDEPDTYRFRCAFHPTIEFGTLTLS